MTDSDLDKYKQTGSYTEGKVNPFELEETTNSINGNNQVINNEISQITNDIDEENNVDKNSTGTFFNEEGIK